MYYARRITLMRKCKKHRRINFKMIKKLSNIPFNGTAEQEAQLKAVIDAKKHDKSLIMTVMQEAQNIYGYRPIEVQSMIAEGMGVPLEKVYGVSTFVSGPLATLRARARYTISFKRFWASEATSAPLTENSLFLPAVA